jgi:hypothetical protein
MTKELDGRNASDDPGDSSPRWPYKGLWASCISDEYCKRLTLAADLAQAARPAAGDGFGGKHESRAKARHRPPARVGQSNVRERRRR